MSLKQKDLDREALGAAIREVQSRYGVIAESALEVKGPVDAAPQALPKEAAFTAVQIVKRFEFDLPFAMQEDFVVKPNTVLEAWTARTPNSPVDPYLVAFYTTNAAQGGGRYTFNVAAANDDQAAGNLDPHFTWKNTTGATKTVRIMAFAYDDNSGGLATLVVLNNGSVWHSPGIMRGKVQFVNNVPGGVPAGCAATGKDRIYLKRLEGGGFGNGVIAVNLVTKKGGYLIESGEAFQSLDLLDALGSGESKGLLMGFTLDQDEPAYEFTRFKTEQGHLLTCN